MDEATKKVVDDLLTKLGVDPASVTHVDLVVTDQPDNKAVHAALQEAGPYLSLLRWLGDRVDQQLKTLAATVRSIALAPAGDREERSHDALHAIITSTHSILSAAERTMPCHIEVPEEAEDPPSPPLIN